MAIVPTGPLLSRVALPMLAYGEGWGRLRSPRCRPFYLGGFIFPRTGNGLDTSLS